MALSTTRQGSDPNTAIVAIARNDNLMAALNDLSDATKQNSADKSELMSVEMCSFVGAAEARTTTHPRPQQMKSKLWKSVDTAALAKHIRSRMPDAAVTYILSGHFCGGTLISKSKDWKERGALNLLDFEKKTIDCHGLSREYPEPRATTVRDCRRIAVSK